MRVARAATKSGMSEQLVPREKWLDSLRVAVAVFADFAARSARLPEYGRLPQLAEFGQVSLDLPLADAPLLCEPLDVQAPTPLAEQSVHLDPALAVCRVHAGGIAGMTFYVNPQCSSPAASSPRGAALLLHGPGDLPRVGAGHERRAGRGAGDVELPGDRARALAERLVSGTVLSPGLLSHCSLLLFFALLDLIDPVFQAVDDRVEPRQRGGDGHRENQVEKFF